MPVRIQLTDARKKFITDNYEKLTNAELKESLGVSITMIRKWCYSLGLYRMELEYWTEEQITFLKENYKVIGDKELVIIYNNKWPKKKKWTIKHIEKKRGYLGFKRNRAELSKIKLRNVARGSWANMTTWDTRGAAPTGEIRIWRNKADGYKMKVIKTDRGFFMYSRWLYEKHFGAIPKGHVVTFKDGDSMNVVPENLYTIPRQEIALRFRYKYPSEIRNLDKLLNQFNQFLKQKQ